MAYNNQTVFILVLNTMSYVKRFLSLSFFVYATCIVALSLANENPPRIEGAVNDTNVLHDPAQRPLGICYLASPESRITPASHITSPLPGDLLSREEIPLEFDWRNVNGVNYVTRDLQEHLPTYCGSCWAHGAVSSVSDRFKIMKRGAWPDVTLSVQEIINCGGDMTGNCGGGSDLGAYAYMHKSGVVDDTCQIYRAMNLPCDDLYKCASCWGTVLEPKCSPVFKYDMYFVDQYGPVPKNSTHHMEAEIFMRGPISCGVDDRHMVHYDGSYIIEGDGEKVNHIISVVGWGREESDKPPGHIPYWIVRNSWGTSWGDKGWAKVRKGVNSSLIEQSCNFATPKWPPTTFVHGKKVDSERVETNRNIDVLATRGHPHGQRGAGGRKWEM